MHYNIVHCLDDGRYFFLLCMIIIHKENHTAETLNLCLHSVCINIVYMRVKNNAYVQIIHLSWIVCSYASPGSRSPAILRHFSHVCVHVFMTEIGRYWKYFGVIQQNDFYCHNIIIKFWIFEVGVNRTSWQCLS